MAEDIRKAEAKHSNSVRTALARVSRTWGGQAWQRLDPERRLELVECALRAPANDLIDDLPLAL